MTGVQTCALPISTFATLAYNKSGNQTLDEIIENTLIFPNPTNEDILLEFSQAITSSITIQINNVYGELIKTCNYQFVDQIEVDMSAYSYGTYFIQIISSESTKVFKVQKI